MDTILNAKCKIKVENSLGGETVGNMCASIIRKNDGNADWIAEADDWLDAIFQFYNVNQETVTGYGWKLKSCQQMPSEVITGNRTEAEVDLVVRNCYLELATAPLPEYITFTVTGGIDYHDTTTYLPNVIANYLLNSCGVTHPWLIESAIVKIKTPTEVEE